jgi:hypothetical protein
MGGMDDERYGRVTNPERYRVLHEAATRAVSALESRYLVDRQAGLGLDPELIARAGAIAVERLVPQDRDAAPVTIAFTDFPGVIVRFGRWHVEAFPACGCDACDESPEDLTELLLAELDAIALGDYSETETSYNFTTSLGDSSGWGRAGTDRPDDHTMPRPPAAGWRPWAVRPDAL